MGCSLVLFAMSAAAAAPAHPSSTAVVVTRRTNVAIPESRALAAQVAATLEEAGLPQSLSPDEALQRLGVKDTGACQGRKACTSELARQLNVESMVAVSLARVQGELAIGLELVRASDGVALATDSVLLPSKAKLSAGQVRAFVAKALAALGPAESPPPPPPAVASGAPVNPALVPAPQPAPVLVVPAPQERSHTATVALGAAAGVAVVAAVVLGVLAVTTRSDLERSEQVGGETLSAHTYPEAQALAGRVNLLTSFTAAGGVLALALGAGAVFAY